MRMIFDNNIKEIEEFTDRNSKLGILDETIEIFDLFPSNGILFKILCLLEQKYLVSHHKFVFYKNYHSGRVLHLPKTDMINENFEKRLKENIKDSPMAITGTMLYLKFIYGQDVTPRAKHRKEELGKKLWSTTEVNLSFCKMLVEYCSNLFTTKQDLLQTF